MENWTRPYLEESEAKPRLFYAVLGNFANPEVIEFKAQLDEGLDCRLIEADFFKDGILWDWLVRDQQELAEIASGAKSAIVVEGQVESSDTLDYLQTTLDFLTHLCDEGGVAVHDPFTFSWFGVEEWHHLRDVGQLFSPFDHAVILQSSEDDESTWLHTRGMLKFGRPDLSVRGVRESDIPVVKKMIDRFIAFQALGGIIDPHRTIHFDGLPGPYQASAVLGSLDDPDFNNEHVELSPAP